jgi:hypothetical protein
MEGGEKPLLFVEKIRAFASPTASRRPEDRF